MSRLPLIIGHRGASAHAPENTLAALKLALDHGADGVEFDVRLARDGVPVVIHDVDLRRVADRFAAVSSLTCKELAAIDVGSWFNSAFPKSASVDYTKEAIPSLTRVLELLSKTTGPIYLELKSDGGDPTLLVEKVSEIISGSSLLPRLIVKSFCLDTLARFGKTRPEVETAALFEPTVKTVFRSRADMVAMATDCGARQLSLHWSLVNRRLLEASGSASMPLTVWTVDHAKWVNKARQLGIRALITNDPAKLIAVRNELP